MENFISKDLLNKVQSENISESVRMFSAVDSSRSTGKLYGQVSVFLSHKHNETEIIKKVVTMLKKLGVNVYLDWMDSGMPKHTSGETAIKIKDKIKSSDKFILLATDGAINSKWCNWELGFGDAHKYSKNIAIMPITESASSSFSGSEYLQIYPVITSQLSYTTGGEYYVEFKGKKINLKDWLKQ